MEDYIVRDDWVGKAMSKILCERSAAGVDVRLMYDPIGSFATAAAYFDTLRDSGIKVHAFHPIGRSLLKLDFRQLNTRDHRRLFVIDDAIGYFGGMNIGDYGGRGSKRPRASQESPVDATWPDVHVRIAGPRQADLAAAFDGLWQRVHGRPSPAPSPWQLDSLRDATDEESISFFDSDPRGTGRSPVDVLVPLLERARSSITLLIAYFIPQGAVLDELIAAARRGVKVRVVVPAKSDVKVVQYATRHMYRSLIQHGIEVYERKNQMLHAKTIIVDRQWCMVGSSNLDPRSFWINLEFFAVIRSDALAELLNEFAANEFMHSEQVTLAKTAQRWWWQRGVDALAWQFRDWL